MLNIYEKFTYCQGELNVFGMYVLDIRLFEETKCPIFRDGVKHPVSYRKNGWMKCRLIKWGMF